MHIGLLGFGVVGRGVYELAQGRSDLAVSRVLVRSPNPELGDLATENVQDILADPAIDTVVEVGMPKELNTSSKMMSVTITAIKMQIKS